jgi:hypothetical protein
LFGDGHEGAQLGDGGAGDLSLFPSGAQHAQVPGCGFGLSEDPFKLAGEFVAGACGLVDLGPGFQQDLQRDEQGDRIANGFPGGRSTLAPRVRLNPKAEGEF